MASEVGSTSELEREPGWENGVINRLINAAENVGVAVPDKFFGPGSLSGEQQKKEKSP